MPTSPWISGCESRGQMQHDPQRRKRLFFFFFFFGSNTKPGPNDRAEGAADGPYRAIRIGSSVGPARPGPTRPAHCCCLAQFVRLGLQAWLASAFANATCVGWCGQFGAWCNPSEYLHLPLIQQDFASAPACGRIPERSESMPKFAAAALEPPSPSSNKLRQVVSRRKNWSHPDSRARLRHSRPTKSRLAQG